jgi:hypothetical protein
MEAAVTLSRTLTDAGVKHCFPGGSLIKLLTTEMSVEDTGWEPERDIREVHGLFVLLGGHPFHILPKQHSQNELQIGFTDLKHDQNITVRFPGKNPSTHSSVGPNYYKDTPYRHLDHKEKDPEDFRSRADEVNLDPVSLFNYRLWFLATHLSFGEQEVRDIESLVQAFKHNLQVNRKRVDVENARRAVDKIPMLEHALVWLGVDLSLEGCGTSQFRQTSSSYSDEQEFIHEVERQIQSKDEEPPPKFEEVEQKHHV